MILLEETEVLGFEHAIRGMRNPMNSWDRMDSAVCRTSIESDILPCDKCIDVCTETWENGTVSGYHIGENDRKLMTKLAKGGPVHAKYRRMITVYVDITAPLYWWKEFDTYKVGTVANSCSTMHKLTHKEFELSDFSHEHLTAHSREILSHTINALNFYRVAYLSRLSNDEKPLSNEAKDIWWQMIQLLPSSYNQKRTIMMNYEVLVGIFRDRQNHKLDEWKEFCEWIDRLPYSEIITIRGGV